MTRVLIKPWPELAEELRAEHNGVMGVYLYFGHDGDNRCEFKDSDARSICYANSGESMQEAVERCYADWCIIRGRAMTNPNPVAPKTAKEKGSMDPDIPYCEQDDYDPEVGIDICAHGLPLCDECEDCEEEEDFEDEDGNYAGT